MNSAILVGPKSAQRFGRSSIRAITLLAGFFCLASTRQGIANGGTFDTSTIRATGNLEPVRKNKIVLESERIKTRLDGDFATVEVRYVLKNQGGADQVTYGFPVDTGNGQLTGKDSDLKFEISEDRSFAPLPVQEIIRQNPFPASALPQGGSYGQTIRAWHVVSLNFAKGETKTLFVKYRVRNLGQTTGTSKDTLWAESARKWIYDLSPSQTWGDGRVGRLEIEVDATPLLSKGIPVNRVEPAGATENKGIYRWSFENFDLRQAPDLVVEYNNPERQRNDEIESRLLPSSVVEKIEVSSERQNSRSTDANYGKENLLDGDFATAWMEGVDGPGRGQWIEVTFKKRTLLKFVTLANGYWKNTERLVENGAIKKLRVQSFRADSEYNRDVVLDLEKPRYDAALPFAQTTVLWEGGDGPGEEIRTLRLTIEEAEPGTRYSDTAVSELIFGGSGRENQ